MTKPYHFHGILMIVGEASAVLPRKESKLLSADASPLHPIGTRPASLGAIIQNLKSISARKINTLLHSAGAPIWQRNYYEHIIRNETEWNRIRAYILANPLRWEVGAFA